MQLFHTLFGSKLQFEYDCFDRIVLNGYLSFMTRENNLVYFFRNVCGFPRITREVLEQRTRIYQAWVESFAANHALPISWAAPKERKEDTVAGALRRMQQKRRTGVYYILKSMEQGPTFRLLKPKYPAADPMWIIVRKHRSRYTHYYFYIVDPMAGPMILRVGSFLPFLATAYLNGHSWIERTLQQQGVSYRKADNSFLAAADPAAVSAASDGMQARAIQTRVEYWLHIVGPKFSAKERAQCAGLHRFWSLTQVEYCRNFVFKRSFPIRWIFERSCELGLYLLTADRIAQIFTQSLRRRWKGKLTTVIERMDHGFFVFRAYWKHGFLKQYQKWSTFLRNELVSNNLKDFGLKKGLANLEAVRNQFKIITARYTDFQAQTLNVHGELNLFSRLARPVTLGKSKIAGIKLENERTQRLLEVLLRQGHSLPAWTTRQLLAAICARFELNPKTYTLSQLRYDLRKLRAHGLLERDGRRYAYRLTTAGQKAALLMTLFRKRIYGPIAASTFLHHPNHQWMPNSSFERLYHKIDRNIDELLDLLAA